MRKKSAALLLALLLLLSLAACGGGESGSNSGNTQAPNNNSSSTNETTPTDPPAADTEAPAANDNAPQAPDTYLFQSGGCTMYVDQDMAEVLAVLEAAKSYFEAPSCAFEGLDKTYTYNGFIITTRPDGDKDYINSIELTDDSVTTAEGLYIGNTVAEVQAVLGEGTPMGTAITYTKGNTVLQFVTENDVVTSICYLSANT